MLTNYLLIGTLGIMIYMSYELYKLHARVDHLADALLATMVGLKVTIDKVEMDEDNERQELSREQEETDRQY